MFNRHRTLGRLAWRINERASRRYAPRLINDPPFESCLLTGAVCLLSLCFCLQPSLDQADVPEHERMRKGKPPNQRKSRSRASSTICSPDKTALTNGGCGAGCISYKWREGGGFAINSRMHSSRGPSTSR